MRLLADAGLIYAGLCTVGATLLILVLAAEILWPDKHLPPWTWIDR